MNSGYIKEYSEQWYEFQNQINDVKEAIQESDNAMAEFLKTIREIEWERFDYTEERIDRITEETEFLIDLLGRRTKLFDEDTGFITDKGTATLGLYAEEFDVYMAKANDYSAEYAKVQKQLAEDPYNTDIQLRLEELRKLWQENIASAENMKDSMKSLIEEGVNAQLDALSKLIDKYKESLSDAKSLYDYSKNIRNINEEISSYQKQLRAYSGDDSEETRATVQQLQKALKESRENLEETQYQRYIEDTEKLLDNMYEEYSEYWNDWLDNFDAHFVELIDYVNKNAESINNTISSSSDRVGYELSESMRSIWADGGAGRQVIADYSKDYSSALTTINGVLSGIKTTVDSMAKKSDTTATTTKTNTSASTAVTKPSTTSTAPAPVAKPATTTTSTPKWGSWFIGKKDSNPKSKLNKESSIVDFK